MAISTFSGTLATSTPLNLCDGFPLFSSGTARAGLTSAGDQLPLLNNPEYVVGGVSLAGFLGGTLFVGLCGPSYATSVTLSQGTFSNGQASFLTTQDDTQGGLVFGASLSLNLNMNLGLWVANQEDENYPLSFTFEIDLLQLLVTLILQQIGNQRFTQFNTLFPQIGSTWGLFDEQTNQYNAGGPVILNPTLVFPINVEPMMEAIPDIGEGIKGVNEVLGSVGGGIAFGPTFSVGLQINIDLQNFGIGGFAPAPLEYSNTLVWSTTLTQRDGSPPSQATLEFEHVVDQLDFGLGAFAQITVGDCFNLVGNLGPFTIGHIQLNSETQLHSLAGQLTSPTASAWEVVFG